MASVPPTLGPYQMRAAVSLLFALAAALPALAAAPASADVGPRGWGISDDFHTPRVSLDATFDELAPQSFRMTAWWESLDDPAFLEQVETRIAEANAAAPPGRDMEIAVSFSSPREPVTDGRAWIARAAPFIDRFSSDVEWWSPANEPNLRGWTFSPEGASMVADFSRRPESYLAPRHPAD